MGRLLGVLVEGAGEALCWGVEEVGEERLKEGAVMEVQEEGALSVSAE